MRQSAESSHTTQSKTRSALLNWIMIQCTRVHVRRVRLVDTGFYSELAKRRGEKVAIVAAARKLMRAMYIMLKEGQDFRLDG
jgi:hypothetical protein